MTSANVQSVPTKLIEAVFRSDADGRPTLPGLGRDEADAWLRRILVDFDRLKGHLSFLETLYQEPLKYERPDPWGERAYRLPLQQGPSKFRHRDPLPDDRIAAVADEGVRALSGREVGELLLNPPALLDLYRLIDELSPEAWHEAWHELGKDLVAADAAESGPSADARPDEPPMVLPPRPRSPYPWLRRGVAIAASFLLGAAVVWKVPRDGGPALVKSDWSAEATYQFKETRGDKLSGEVGIRSDLDGFATIIVLSQGEDPEVTPDLGGELIRIRPGILKESSELVTPPKNPTTGLVVVSVTPADAEIRRALQGRKFSPGEVEELRTYLDAQLRELNYRDLAFTRVLIPIKPN